MGSSSENSEENRENDPPPGEPQKGESSDSNNRRRFLQLSLTIGLVLALGGVASVARSLFNPSAAPPNPPPPATETATQTVTSTAVETITVGSRSSSESSSETSSSSESSSESSESTSSTSTSSTTSSPFPKILVGNISDLSAGQTVTFAYPLEETPNILVKLGVQALGGVGPDGDIVAFSQVCQHLGCIYGYVPSGSSPKCDSSYKASGPVGYCCCHGSVYDLSNGAKVVAGPAPRPQPQVTLEFDSATGNIYAIGMGPPTIYGHDTGSNNVLEDLQGGTPVG